MRSRGVGIALVVGLMLCLPAVGCSLGGQKGKTSAGDDVVIDPCEPECCCRAKDNYYVRYSCSSRVQCMQDGGECTTDKLSKCQTEVDKASETEAVER